MASFGIPTSNDPFDTPSSQYATPPPFGLPPTFSPQSFLTRPMQLAPQLPPPPPQAVEIDDALTNSDLYQLLSIEATMIVAVVMSCIMLFGSLRKRTVNAFFKLCLWATVVSTPLLISYCIGQLTSNTHGSRILNNELFLIWGIVLLTGLASYGTISAFQLEDNETALVAYVQGFLKCSFVFGMLLNYNGKEIPVYIKWILHFLVPLMLLGLADRANSLGCASKTNLSGGVGSRVEIVYEYMEQDVEKTLQAGEEAAEADPKSMGGYRYLVGMKSLLKKETICLPPCYHRDFENEKEALVTTEEIWECEGELLSSRGGDPQGRLKDTCLSFALFWMLLRRYAGYSLAEVTSLEVKTWNFVRYGLIPDLSQATSERAFRVIEQELSFLYDYFYTKNFVIYLNGTRNVFFRFIIMVAFSLIAAKILKNHKTSLPVAFSHNLKAINLDALITKVVLFTMLMSELVILVHYLFITQWSRVEWVCTYVRMQLWKRQTWKDTCLRWAIERIFHHSLHQKNFKHWKKEIGQYSLLLSHDYKTPIRYFSDFIIPETLLDISTMSRKASNSIPFSANLKTAVLSTLHLNGQKLSNGKSSMRKYGLETEEFSWALNLQTHTQTILVWHIATSFCELSHFNRYPSHLEFGNLLVATSLSKYCAYLVAFAPELLPDQTNTTYNIMNYVILEANSMFKGCSNMEAKYEKMRAMTDQCNGAKDPTLYKGIWLGKSLVNRMSYMTLWEMLAELWAELLLYLAPSDDVASHIKHLADGGELITHLWTLLTHAGIIKRD